MTKNPSPILHSPKPHETFRHLFALFDRIRTSALTRTPETSHRFLKTLLDDLGADILSVHANTGDDNLPADMTCREWALIRKLEQIEELIEAFEAVPDTHE